MNYKRTVTRSDGSLLILTNFPKTGPLDKKLAAASDYEVQRILKKAGHLEAYEDESIHCIHKSMQSGVPVFVSCGEGEGELFSGL